MYYFSLDAVVSVEIVVEHVRFIVKRMEGAVGFRCQHCKR